MVRVLLILMLGMLAGPESLALEPPPASTWQVAAKKKTKKRRRKRRRRGRRGKAKKKAVQKKVVEQPATPAEAAEPKAKASESTKSATVSETAKPAAALAPGLAVLDLVTQQGMSKGTAQLLNDAILARLNDSARFSSVLSGSDIKAMVSLEMQRTSLGCEVDSCLAELGGALGVPLMLVPTMGQVGDQIVFNLKVLNVDTAKVVARETMNLPDENSLLKVLPVIVDRAVAKTFGDEPPPLPVVEAPRVVVAPVAASRVPLWVGMGMGAGGAVLALLAPSNADLLAKRSDYEAERNVTRAEQRFNELQALQDEAMLMRVGGAVIGVTGLGVATWSLLRGRGQPLSSNVEKVSEDQGEAAAEAPKDGPPKVSP